MDDWLETKATTNDPVEKFLAVKLGFAFTDLRRFSHFAMRGAQYLEALTPADRNLFNATRREVNVFECAAGVHWWLRQVSLHAWFYRFLHVHTSSQVAATLHSNGLAGVNDKGAEADCAIPAESARPEYPWSRGRKRARNSSESRSSSLDQSQPCPTRSQAARGPPLVNTSSVADQRTT